MYHLGVTYICSQSAMALGEKVQNPLFYIELCEMWLFKNIKGNLQSQ